MSTTIVKERPILYSPPMVRARLAGLKTQTRRMVKPILLNGKGWIGEVIRMWPLPSDPCGFGCEYVAGKPPKAELLAKTSIRCPYGRVGDRLWVRESMRWEEGPSSVVHGVNVRDPDTLVYVADGEPVEFDGSSEAALVSQPSRCRNAVIPSIHMPRWASRGLDEIVDIRVQRLGDITDDDAIAEGCPGGNGSIPGYPFSATPREHFAWVWYSVRHPGAVHNEQTSQASHKLWVQERDRWVWAITFKVLENAGRGEAA